ncbi:MAG: Glu/Leu/Phe/Val dehydrogenase dimerization domain-containing protein, partial [Dehalococcoidia bacterium]
MDGEGVMGLFQSMAAEGHEAVAYFANPDVGLRCIIAIHDTTLGPALGGTRMWPYATEAEALTDVLRLSKAMTYKAALAGLDLGGGKAVIMGDPARDKTEALLRAYGRAVDSFGVRYITASDVGTTPQDLEIIMQQTRWMLGRPRESGGSGDSAPATAYGVLQAMRACADDVFGDPSLSGRTVVMQGFGKVASSLARRLKDEGARLVVAEIVPQARERAAGEFGARIVAPDEIFDVEGHIFAPCALGGVLNDSTIPRLRCPIVAGSANNQLAEQADADRLEAAGILYAPDYAVNAGGIINLSFELTGYEPEVAMA